MKHMHMQLNYAMLVLIGATLGWSAVAAAQDRAVQSTDRVVANVVKIEALDDGALTEIEIRVDGDDITAVVNGERVPADRIKVDRSGAITILDKDGNPIGGSRSIMVRKLDAPERLRQTQIEINRPERADVRRLREEVDGIPVPPPPPDRPDAPAAPRVMLGVHMEEPDLALCRHLQLDPGTSTMIVGVFEGLPAQSAGLREFDVIIAIDGEQPADPLSIRRMLSDREPGDVLTLDVIQSGERQTVELSLKAFDADAMSSARLIGHTATATAPRAGVITVPNMHRRHVNEDVEFDVDWEALGGAYARAFQFNHDGDEAEWHLFTRSHIAPAINAIRQVDVEKLIESQSERVTLSTEAIEQSLERLQQRMEELEGRLERQAERSGVDMERLMDRLAERLQAMERRIERAIDRSRQPG